jgi:hypothetical protein
MPPRCRACRPIGQAELSCSCSEAEAAWIGALAASLFGLQRSRIDGVCLRCSFLPTLSGKCEASDSTLSQFCIIV